MPYYTLCLHQNFSEKENPKYMSKAQKIAQFLDALEGFLITLEL
jgi:hypothetical protein